MGRPQKLLQRGIYLQIASALRGGPWRRASMVMLAGGFVTDQTAAPRTAALLRRLTRTRRGQPGTRTPKAERAWVKCLRALAARLHASRGGSSTPKKTNTPPLALVELQQAVDTVVEGFGSREERRKRDTLLLAVEALADKGVANAAVADDQGGAARGDMSLLFKSDEEVAMDSTRPRVQFLTA